MLIAYGIYRFWPKRVAFRNDFCRTCQAPRRAQQQRTFDFFHIFRIPLIPLGFWKRWFCTVCGKNPHVTRGTRRPFKWIGLAILLLMDLLFWIVPFDTEMQPAALWLMRIGFPVGAVLLLAHLLRTPRETPLKQQLAKIVPADDTACPFCGTHLLLLASQSSCPNCHVLRL